MISEICVPSCELNNKTVTFKQDVQEYVSSKMRHNFDSLGVILHALDKFFESQHRQQLKADIHSIHNNHKTNVNKKISVNLYIPKEIRSIIVSYLDYIIESTLDLPYIQNIIH